MNAITSVEAAKAASANDTGLSATDRRKGYRNGGSQRRFDSIDARGSRFRMPDDHPALVEGRTTMLKRVFAPGDVPRLLISGVNSRKIGKKVTKGPWRGFPIFTLTLEERATCPRTCTEWRSCYGSNMQYARRIEHGPEFERLLLAELEAKQRAHPAGFVVRLHILGDFYSVDYANLWGGGIGRIPGAPRVRLHGPRPEKRDRRGRPCADTAPPRPLPYPLQRARRAETRIRRDRARPADRACRLPRPDRRDRLLRDLRAVLALRPHHRILEALT